MIKTSHTYIGIGTAIAAEQDASGFVALQFADKDGNSNTLAFRAEVAREIARLLASVADGQKDAGKEVGKEVINA